MQPCETARPSTRRVVPAVQADDAAARPLGQLRVGARLEGERAEVGLLHRLEAGGDVEEAGRRLHAGSSDRDPVRVDELPVLPELDHPGVAEDDDLPRDRVDRDLLRGHPARAAVRPAGDRDLVPGDLPADLLRPDGEDVAVPVVLRAELAQLRDHGRVRARRRPDDELRDPDRAGADDGLRRRLADGVGRRREREQGCGREQELENAWRAYGHVKEGVGDGMRAYAETILIGRADGDDRAQVLDIFVEESDAPVRDGLADELRRVRAVDADDAAAGPVGELRVPARLECVCPEHGPARVVFRLHVEEAERRFHPGPADRDRPRSPELAGDVELELPRAAVDHEPTVDRLQRRCVGGDPAGAAVRAARHRDPVPGGLSASSGRRAARARARRAGGSRAGTASASSASARSGSAASGPRPSS